jgi:hypothetical protein
VFLSGRQQKQPKLSGPTLSYHRTASLNKVIYKKHQPPLIENPT